MTRWVRFLPLFRFETGKPEISDRNKGYAKKIRIFNWSIRDKLYGMPFLINFHLDIDNLTKVSMRTSHLVL